MTRAPRPSERALPHNIEAERAVLGGLLLAPDRLATIADRLEPADFHLERHRQIFRAMLELARAEQPIDLRTLQDRLERAGVFERMGGLTYLAGLDLDLPDLGQLEVYAEIVRERSLRRRLIELGTALARDGFDGRPELGDLLARAESDLKRLRDASHRTGSTNWWEGLHPVFEQLEERAEPGSRLGLLSGFEELDALTQGFAAGNLVVLAGRPGMGKSALALHVAQHAAIVERRGVGYFSLEMSFQELAERLLAAESGLPLASVRAARLTDEQWRRLFAAAEATREAPLWIDDSPLATLEHLQAEARRLRSDHDIELVVVDYLQLMSIGRRHETRQLEIATLSRRLKLLAKELEIPVLAVSQLSREPERRSSKRPQLSDLRESGAIEQDADLVLFVFREELYEPDDPALHGTAELIVAKQRNGPVGTVRLRFEAELARFRGLEYR